MKSYHVHSGLRSTEGPKGIIVYGYVMIVLALLTFSSIAIVEPATIRDNGCTISIGYPNGDLKEPQLLLLSNEKNRTNFLYPINKLGTVKLRTGENVLFACPGEGNYIQGVHGSRSLNEIEAQCLDGKTFNTASNIIDLRTLTCKFLPANVARRTNNRCYNNAVHLEIGFQLKKTFVRTIEVCRDEKTMMTYWSKFRLSSKIDGFQSSFPRPKKWQIGDFYKNYGIDKQYQSYKQIDTIAKQLGSMELARRYINPSKQQFLARGHLTAKADLIYGTEQSSTFWYVNAAPQWQSFNGGNWNTLERSVRNYVTRGSSDLEVYTGTYGQTNLVDVNGNEVPIYLYADGNDRAFPVPKFFWKIIYDPSTNRATAFVGYNNPWTKRITDDMFICNDISNEINWIQWESNDFTKGVSYACNVDELRKSIPSIPRLKINDILT